MRDVYPDSPFHLGNERHYLAWRERKLYDYPTVAGDLIVTVANPLKPAAHEREAMRAILHKTNMVLYAAQTHKDDGRVPIVMGGQFGLHHLDHNYLAESSGLSAITVSDGAIKPAFIPYTSRALKWHTDGYYNSGDELIRAFILHCVNDAASGGDNALLDPEIIYLLLRDENPDYIRAFMQADIMSIPARLDEDGVARAAVSGPVFRIDPLNGALHMRYTARKRNIRWRDDSLSKEALSYLESLLASPLPYIFHAHLAPGMGLLCNNVVHDRGAFSDTPEHGKRLLYRARFFDRVSDS